MTSVITKWRGLPRESSLMLSMAETMEEIRQEELLRKLLIPLTEQEKLRRNLQMSNFLS